MRRYTTNEMLHRDFLNKKRKVIKKCNELGIVHYDVNSPELYATPDKFICVISPNEYEIGESFSEKDTNPESVFISLHDYQIFDKF